MSREISAFAIQKASCATWITSFQMQSGIQSGQQGIKMSGCGMDMGFAMVYSLGSVLWPKGKTAKPRDA